MDKILNNRIHREEILQKANIHYKKFNWDRTVNETMKVLLN